MVEQAEIKSAQANEVTVLYSGPANYADKIYASFDPQNKLSRLAFCESWQASTNMTFLGAFLLTETGVSSLIKLLQDLEQKFKQESLRGTLQ